MHSGDVHISTPKSKSRTFHSSSFLDNVAFRRTIISRIWDIISCPGFQLHFISIRRFKVRLTAVNCHSSVGMISQLQTRMDSYGSESAPSVLAIWMREMMAAVGGKIQEPGSERFATIGPSPVVQVLPSCLGEPVEVIQGSPADPLLARLSPLLLARPFSIDHGSSHLVFMR